jgi:putative ABC transport system ATP-binding protein
MVDLEDIEKVYRTDRIETQALSGINFQVKAGEFVAIMGPSGCGKTTLLNIVGLLDAPTSGVIHIDSQPVSDWNDKRISTMRNERIGFVFQSFHLIHDLSIIDNVEIPLLYRRISGKERKERCYRALERVGLTSRSHHRPTQLSGGQQQRVAIARAIVGRPALLLADEPTGNLDSQMGKDIMDILLGLNREEGTTIIMVTHDSHLADQTNRTVHLFDGRQVS